MVEVGTAFETSAYFSSGVQVPAITVFRREQRIRSQFGSLEIVKAHVILFSGFQGQNQPLALYAECEVWFCYLYLSYPQASFRKSSMH